MHLAPRPLDLASFTRGVVAAFAPVAERKGIRLTVETPDALRGARSTPTRSRRSSPTSLSNAIKFTPSGGRVHVALSETSDGVVLVVARLRPGDPSEQLAHVFERFYQVDEIATRAQPGTGIGLSLVKELVELHGGTIEVSSGEAPGRCSRVTLPLGEPARRHAPRPALS